ncbi:hypothetical protein J5N97_022782 [Dioscorea zingiberensis]|uniref:Uncharacterized protein n=1 Tax=Dioscorea zingiberensis TaxID=325984 RepID=A0A9D5CBU8_9LILI|nr:hypothetical protein J5N97_022782 [Dioscorea zingiberensis]
MNEALQKIKAELMLLGFISLLLTVGQEPISKISGRNYCSMTIWFLVGTTSDQCSKYKMKKWRAWEQRPLH